MTSRLFQVAATVALRSYRIWPPFFKQNEGYSQRKIPEARPGRSYITFNDNDNVYGNDDVRNHLHPFHRV